MASLPSTQKAWYYEGYGGVEEILKLGDQPVPTPDSDQVLIKVHAVGLNPIDNGRFKGYLGQTAFPTVPGYDVAGTVVKVGSAVTQFKEGDAVFGDMHFVSLQPLQFGAMAEYTAVPEKCLALKPAGLSFEEAAALPVAVLTGLQGLKQAHLDEGGKLLVTGGAGGVGLHTIQVAKKIFKAHVATTASAAKFDVVKAAGADVVVDYKTEKFEEKLSGYDVVFDTTGEVEKGLQVINDGGTVISITRFDLMGRLPPKVALLSMAGDGKDLQGLLPLIESKDIKPIIDPKGSYTFDKAIDAFVYLSTGRATGKVVVTVA